MPRVKKEYTVKELEEFKKQILEQIDKINELIEHKLEAGSKSVSEESRDTHIEEMGTENNLRELDLYIAQREEKFISNLENALKRIDSGTYGVCRACGKLISKKRLKLVPHATLCIECKSNRERD